MSHQAQVPPVAARYFEISDYRRDHPIITQIFYPDRGWQTNIFTHRVSGAWLRKLKDGGATAVALTSRGRTAEFTIAELLRKNVSA